MKETESKFRRLLFDLFDLKGEKEDELKTIESLRQDVEFKGTKMWILICAILIASLGLNMNSTAVIIGAMLISPLMGPIIGLGLGLGITDFNLVRRSLKHFGFATVVSIITSTIYFMLTPIDTAQSEILARTQPTTFDVFIALAGGFAGIIAGASKAKGNVIPGVAIATALMPPLCTAGYGLGTGQFSFFFGAFYLYIINTVFIALATFITVRALKYPRMSYMDPKRGGRLNNLVIFIVICTLIPSILLASQMIRQSVYEEREKAFVKAELNLENNYLLSYETTHRNDSTFMFVSMIGEEIPQSTIDVLQAKMGSYGLNNARLIIHQGYNSTNVDRLKSSILSDIDKKANTKEDFIRIQNMKIDSLQNIVNTMTRYKSNSGSISRELKSLFPAIVQSEFSRGFAYTLSTERRDSLPTDTVSIIILYSKTRIPAAQQKTIEEWLALRLPGTKVKFSTDINTENR